ncbi:esterase-like activity of phytase family protein [Psychrobacter sp.]|uniref:esterase-like activity of phytase family protein n=1 Tax=Psychrobacter sp. TaxID=56811 RepID=UPI0025D9E1A2|nr:esterase-like activity of phytase family protein [Psychrobacter sp.]
MITTTKLYKNIVFTTLTASVLALLSGCSTPLATQDGSIPVKPAIGKTQNSPISDLNIAIANYQQGTSLPATTLLQVRIGNSDDMVEIRNGGYGSDAAANPANPMQFYVLTDRGPNADYEGKEGKGKQFLTPNYTPRIGLFELKTDGRIEKIKEILLKDTAGNPITGLPNSSKLGGTGELAYDVQGKIIATDASKPFDEKSNPSKTDNFGLDSEGLVALKDGTFWVSDEYGPHLVHFDANGREINRINAFESDERNNVIINGKKILLPGEFANRRANRGMEGLTITPDQTTLVGIMQSTLANPDKAVTKQNITRIVTVNLKTGDIGQYLYKQEKAENSNSGIVALDNRHFLVIERDGEFELQKPGAQKHIYKIALDGATNLEAIMPTANVQQDSRLGLTLAGKTVEQYLSAAGNSDAGWTALTTTGIKPVSKTLVLDAVKAFGYPHDKLEGMWLMGDGRLGLLNDDDFATWSNDNVLEQKYLDSAMTDIDSDRLYIATGLDY